MVKIKRDLEAIIKIKMEEMPLIRKSLHFIPKMTSMRVLILTIIRNRDSYSTIQKR
jgi:hypothetical protein